MGQAEEGGIEKETIEGGLGWRGRIGGFFQAIMNPGRSTYLKQFEEKNNLVGKGLDKRFRERYGDKIKYPVLYEEINKLKKEGKTPTEVRKLMLERYKEKGINSEDIDDANCVVFIKKQVDHEKRWVKNWT